MMKTTFLNKKRDNKGFTLVELIVVLVILVIVVSLSAFGLIAWQDWANFKKQNEYAQTMFNAAQGTLSEYSANQMLSELVDELVAGNIGADGNSTGKLPRQLDVTKLIGSDGSAYSLTDVWYQSQGLTSGDEERYQGVICYAMASKGDYAKYLEGTLNSTTGAEIVFRLLEKTVYDTSLLDAAICIEFTPAEGQVFSVLYSEKNDSFTYTAKEANARVALITDRTEEARHDRMVGYYGVDTLAVSTEGSVSVKNVSLSDVELVNDEMLHLRYCISKDKYQLLTKLDYQITVYDADSKKAVLLFDLNTAQGTIHNRANRAAFPVKVSKYTYDESGKSTLHELGEYPMLVWTEGDASKPYLHLALDAADLQVTEALYISESLDPTGSFGTLGSMKDTFSFHRFGLDADNLYCTVQSMAQSSLKVKASTVKTTNTESAYFGDKTELASSAASRAREAAAYTYTKYISNARHLYNMRYDQALTYAQQNEVSGKVDSDSIRNDYVMKGDFSWTEFVNRGYLYYSEGNFNEGTSTYAITFKKADGTSLLPLAVTGSLGNTDSDELHYIRVGYLDTNQENPAIGSVRVMAECPFPSISKLRVQDSVWGLEKAEDRNRVQNALDVIKDSSAGASEKEAAAQNVRLAHRGKYATLSGFVFSETANEYLKVPKVVETFDTETIEIGATGLFVENFGEMCAFQLSGVYAEGTECIGSFVGINHGEMAALETVETIALNGDVIGAGTVVGEYNVGGIFGNLDEYAEEGQSIYISLLSNRAKVVGTTFVGGIVGQLYMPATEEGKGVGEVVVSFAENYGALEAVYDKSVENASAEKRSQSAQYIGGITGFLNNEYGQTVGAVAGSTQEALDHAIAKLRVEHSVSSPEYSLNDLNALLNMENLNAGNAAVLSALGSRLNGVYVGGVIGYNNFGKVTHCSTEAEDGRKGYVFGYQYVGGIVGFNQGPASGIDGEQQKNAKIQPGVNEANVVGVKYVGGIVGCNADIAQTQAAAGSTVVEPSKERNITNLISNWVNKGIIFASEEYAGGITGYNTGWIYNCNSEVGDTGVDDFFQKTYSGNYAGGIAGYNNGIIGNTEWEINGDGKPEYKNANGKVISHGEISSVCYISGNNFVGGIVGYNDVDAVVEDYAVSGGFIRGNNTESCFVGGYAGFNASVALLMGEDGAAREIKANPNEVSGRYFVGGTVGGIIIATDRSADRPIRASFKTENLLGEMSGEAFVGGFVGYGLLTNAPKSGTQNSSDVIENFLFGSGEGAAHTVGLIEQVSAIDQASIDAIKAGTSASVVLQNRMIGLADMIDGVNLPGATCELRISGAGLNAAGSEDADNNYTTNTLGMISAKMFVGGVLGYVDDDTKLFLQNIKNTTPVEASVSIIRPGQRLPYNPANPDTEMAAGNEIDYTGTGREKFTYSYAGGIIGKVGRNTVVDNCQNTSSASIDAKGTYHGALCEVNEGRIQNCTVFNYGTTTASYVGGVCGLNKGTISNIKAQNHSVSGRNVVAVIAAENLGTGARIDNVQINDVKLNAAGVSVGDAALNTAAVHGVAGLVTAYNGTGATISLNAHLGNNTVASKGDYVGSVAGINDGSILIANEIVDKTTKEAVKVTDAENTWLRITGSVNGRMYVGGVVGLDRIHSAADAVMAHFYNYATVTAQNGVAGGIAGEIAGTATIQFCANEGVVTAATAGNAGGITSENAGTIRNCKEYASVLAPRGKTGGISSINKDDAEISECYVQPVNESAARLSFTSIEKVGAVTAENNGTIRNCHVYRTDVFNYSVSETGYIGIVTGINTAKGKILFENKQLDTINQEEIFIEDCSARTYTNNSYVGGVVGKNEGLVIGTLNNDPNSKTNGVIPVSIISCKVGYVDGLATIANLGGVAGKNIGTIRNISVVGVIDEKEGLGTPANGYGGIAGYSGFDEAQEENGSVIYPAVIEHCTFDGTIWAKGSGINTANIGGIVGVNSYSSLVKECLIGVNDKGNDGKVTGIYAGRVDLPDTYDTYDETKIIKCTIDGASRELSTYYGLDKKGIYASTGDHYGYVVADSNSCSNMGGIAGVNSGRVQSGNNHKYSTDEVSLVQFAGLVGGLVGTINDGGTVTGVGEYGKVLTEEQISDSNLTLSSGDHWRVDKRNARNDEAFGGVIGGIYTPFEIEYVQNYACTTSFYKANAKAGGILGVFQISDSNIPVVFTHCYNYGTVIGNSSVAGIVGEIFFSPIRATDCVNRGDLVCMAIDKREAGGIIAKHENSVGNSVLQNCRNYGAISSIGSNPAIGGIYGNISFTTGALANTYGDLETHFINCVNVGTLSGGASQAGILGVANSDTLGKGIYMQNCRQYGSKAYLLGEIADKPDKVFITDCLVDSDYSSKTDSGVYVDDTTKNPFVQKPEDAKLVTYTNDYYISPASMLAVNNDFSSAEVSAKDYGTYFSVACDMPIFDQTTFGTEIYQQVVTDLLKTPKASSLFLSSIKAMKTNFYFDVTNADNADGMQAFVFYPHNKGDNETACYYDYIIVFTDEDGNEAKVEGTASGVRRMQGTIVNVPEGLSHRLSSIQLTITRIKSETDHNPNDRLYLNGFAWIPVGSDLIVPMASDEEIKKVNAPATFTLTTTLVDRNTHVPVDMSIFKSLAQDQQPGRVYVNEGPETKNSLVELGKETAYFKDFYAPYWGRSTYHVICIVNKSDIGIVSKNNSEQFHFDIAYADTLPESSSLSSFVLYLTDSNGNGTGTKPKYQYDIVFTDEQGNTATYSLDGKDNYVQQVAEANNIPAPSYLEQIVPVPMVEELGRVVSVDVYLKSNTNDLYLKGWGWQLSGSEEILPCVYNVTTPSEIDGDGAVSVDGATAMGEVGENSGYTKLLTTLDTALGKYYLYPEKVNGIETSLGKTAGFYMRTMYNNPAAPTFYSDRKSVNDSMALGINYRYKVYEDLDKQFTEVFLPLSYSFVGGEGYHLDTPAVSVAARNGSYVVTWPNVPNAYKYELSYEVKDEAGNVLMDKDGKEISTVGNPVTINNGTYSYAVTADNSWFDTSQKNTITFYVKANHYVHYAAEANTDYDSETAVAEVNVCYVLPTPDVTIEITDRNANEGSVAILNNRDDYKDANGNYINCEIAVCVAGTDVTCKINPAISANSFKMFTKDASESGSIAYAREINYVEGTMPQQYMSSAVMMHSGSHMFAKDLAGDSEDYMQNPTFEGFYGDTAENLSYKILYRVVFSKNGKDTFTTADLVAYDDELNVDIAYANGTAHTANRVNGSVPMMITSELAGLPTDIVGKEITVRTYFNSTQQHFINAGHYVVQGIDEETLKKYLEGEFKDTKYLDASNAYSYPQLKELWGEATFKAVFPDVLEKDSKDKSKKPSNFVFMRENEICTRVVDEATQELVEYKLKPGYAIYDMQDGTYDIFFSSTLARTINENKGRLARIVTYTPDENDANLYHIGVSKDSISINIGDETVTSQQIQVAPAIEEAVVEGKTDAGKNSYTFSWDQGELGYVNPVYAVELLGYSDAKEAWVSLSTINRQTANTVTFVDAQNNWNYTKFKLEVTRIGTTVDASNHASQTIVLPNTSECEFIVKQRLDAVSMPKVSLTRTDGHFNKDSLLYEVTWGLLNEAEELQRKDLTGYMIKAELAEPKTIGTSETTYMTQFFYVYDNVTNPVHTEAFQGLSEDWMTALEHAYAAADVTEAYTVTDGEGTTIIDLSAFDSLDIVHVSVIAVAKDGAVYYYDAEESDYNEVVIPNRLNAPSVSTILTAAPVYDADPAMALTKEALAQQGIAVSLKDDTHVAADSGVYYIAMAIYENRPLAGENPETDVTGGYAQVGRAGDSTVAGDGAWNDGALLTIAGKSNPKQMSGTNLTTAAYTLRSDAQVNLADYAGKWVKVALRATANSAISSMWSDEDPAEKETGNYFWMQIPMVKLEALTDNVIRTGTISQYLTLEGTENDWLQGLSWSFTDSSMTHANFEIRNKLLMLIPGNYVDDRFVDGMVLKLTYKKPALLGDDNETLTLYFKKLMSEDGTLQYMVYTDDETAATAEAVTVEGQTYTNTFGVVRPLQTEDAANVLDTGAAGNDYLLLPYAIKTSFDTYGNADVLEKLALELNGAVWMNMDGSISVLLPDVDDFLYLVTPEDESNPYLESAGSLVSSTVSYELFAAEEEAESEVRHYVTAESLAASFVPVEGEPVLNEYELQTREEDANKANAFSSIILKIQDVTGND